MPPPFPQEKTIAAEVLESTAPGAAGASYIGIEPLSDISATDTMGALQGIMLLLGTKLSEVQDNGTAIPHRPILDIRGGGRTITDDPTNEKTIITIPGLSDYPHLEKVTLDGAEPGPVQRILNVFGNVNLEVDEGNGRYNLEVPFGENPPADDVSLGLVRLNQPALDPENPGVVEENDPRLSDNRFPLAHQHSGAEITDGTISTERLGTGTRDNTTYLRGDGVFAPPPGVEGGGPLSITDLPVADDGEENENEVVRSTDTRLGNTRTPTPGSVTYLSADNDTSITDICTSTTRPVEPKRGQIIFEIDTNLVMKQVDDPASPNWQPVGSGAASIIVQEEGSTIAQRGTLNFVGVGATVTDDPVTEKTQIAIPGTQVQQAGSNIGTWARLNFTDATVTNDATNERVNISVGTPGGGSDIAVVNTMTDLRARTSATNGEIVELRDYSTSLDGGGGSFIYESVAAVAFTVDITTDTFTATGHGFKKGQQVKLFGSSLPGGVAAGTTYYVAAPSTNTFKLSATHIGSVIPSPSVVDLTSGGTGTVGLDDGGTVITVNGTTPAGRYRRRFSDRINIRWFGCDATGVAPSAGAILRALGAAYLMGGNKVFVPPGRYLLDLPLFVPDNCELEGVGGPAEATIPYGGWTTMSINEIAASVFLCTYGAGTTDSSGSAIVLGQDGARVSGVVCYYPNQVKAVAKWYPSLGTVVGKRVIRDTDAITTSERQFECTSPGTTGATEPAAFATVGVGATVTDGTVTWTRISDTTKTPIAYPPTVSLYQGWVPGTASGRSQAATDMYIPNCYMGIYFTGSHGRGRIENIHIGALHTAIKIDDDYAVPQLHRINVDPYWAFIEGIQPYIPNGHPGTNLDDFVLNNLTAWWIGRADELQASNLFCYECSIGLWLAISGNEFGDTSRAAWGYIHGIGVDACQYAILADQTAPSGLTIDGFYSWPDHGGSIGLWTRASTNYGGATAVTRNTPYSAFDWVRGPGNANPTLYYLCIKSGTTAASAPTYPTVNGGTVTDGTAQFRAYPATFEPNLTVRAQSIGSQNLNYAVLHQGGSLRFYDCTFATSSNQPTVGLATSNDHFTLQNCIYKGAGTGLSIPTNHPGVIHLIGNDMGGATASVSTQTSLYKAGGNRGIATNNW